MLKLKSLTNSEKYSLNFFSIILTSVATLICLCCVYFEVTFKLNNFQWGLLFTCLMAFILGLSLINHISILSITTLFSLTIMLFLGGRFFSVLIDPDPQIFILTYFANYSLNATEATQLFLLVVLSIFSIQIGQYLARINQKKIKHRIEVTHKPLQMLLSIMLPIFSLSIGSIVYTKIIDVIQLGYLGLYKTQSSGAFSPIQSLINTLFSVFIGLSFAYGTKKQKIYYFILLLILSLTMLILGARGPFGAYLLFLLWLYGKQGTKKFSLLKFIIISIILMVSINLIIDLFSFRTIAAGQGFISRLQRFLYTQGITLMVYDISMSLEQYPTIAYFQSFIPGSSFIAKLFNPEITLKDASFPHFLANYLDTELYNKGRGLGWSIQSDFWLFSNRSPILFTVFFTILGYFLTKAEFLSRHHLWVKGLVVTIAPTLFFLARSTFTTFIPLVIYYFVISIVIFLALSLIPHARKLYAKK